jgi:hypothetical protein
MGPSQIEVILRRFEAPDETRVMEKGKFEVVHIGGLTVGRATYEPGWRGPSTLVRLSAPRVARWRTADWWYRARRPQRWRTDASSSFGQATCSIFRRLRTTAGSWGTRRMSPFLGADRYAK